MRKWVAVSAGLAPIALIGGWSLSASRQPLSYDSVRDTISALVARGATDSWIMTAGLAVLGACHLASAAGLTDTGPAARTLLGVGGAATIMVAATPQPNAAHVPAAIAAFLALSSWPALSTLPSRRVGTGAAAVLLALLVWLATALQTDTAIGLSERVLAGAQALCPLSFVIVLAARRQRAPNDAPNG